MSIILFCSYLLREHIYFIGENITHTHTYVYTYIGFLTQLQYAELSRYQTFVSIAQFLTCESLWNTNVLYESCLFILIHARLRAFLHVYCTRWGDLRRSQMFHAVKFVLARVVVFSCAWLAVIGKKLTYLQFLNKKLNHNVLIFSHIFNDLFSFK